MITTAICFFFSRLKFQNTTFPDYAANQKQKVLAAFPSTLQKICTWELYKQFYKII